MEKCSLCGYCEVACPTFLNFRDIVFAPRWRVQEAIMLKKGEIEVTEKVARSLFTCLTCASCVEKCPLNLDIPEIVIAGRSFVPKEKIPTQNEIILKNLLKHKNPFGLKNNFEGQKESDTLLFIGCIFPNINVMKNLLRFSSKLIRLSRIFTSDFSKFLKIFRRKEDVERVNKIISLLKLLGYDFTLLKDEPCCGEIIYNMGYVEEFKKYIAEVHEILKKHGIRRIIALSPFCAFAFKKLYPKYLNGWDIEVLTLAEAINRRFKRGKMKAKITYHDPCYYARHLGIVNEPREILKKIEGLELIEVEKSGRNTSCIGDGGLELYYPNIAYEIAKKRFKELASTKADIIVTQCPACMAMIEWVSCEIQVKDLGELVFESLKRD